MIAALIVFLAIAVAAVIGGYLAWIVVDDDYNADRAVREEKRRLGIPQEASLLDYRYDETLAEKHKRLGAPAPKVVAV